MLRRLGVEAVLGELVFALRDFEIGEQSRDRDGAAPDTERAVAAAHGVEAIDELDAKSDGSAVAAPVVLRFFEFAGHELEPFVHILAEARRPTIIRLTSRVKPSSLPSLRERDTCARDSEALLSQKSD